MQTSLQKPLQKSLQKSLQVIAKVIAKNIAKAGRHDCQHFAHLQANDQSCILPMFSKVCILPIFRRHSHLPPISGNFYTLLIFIGVFLENRFLLYTADMCWNLLLPIHENQFQL